MKIEAKDLCFSFSKETETKPTARGVAAATKETVFTGLSFSLSEERPLAVIGASGIGKTTLMRILLGLEKPQQGTVKGLENKPVCSVVFQEDRLFEQLTCKENWRIVQRDLTKEQIRKMAEALNLNEEILNKKPAECSGGERRRVALGRALLYKADWYCMDEPFTGLDEENRRLAMRAIQETTKGKPLFLITHRREDAKDMGALILDMDRLPKETAKTLR